MDAFDKIETDWKLVVVGDADHEGDYSRYIKNKAQLSGKVVDEYCPKAKIMHCMPCHIGYEIDRAAVDHPNSVIFDQAENRMHMQKAMILWLLGKKV